MNVWGRRKYLLRVVTKPFLLDGQDNLIIILAVLSEIIRNCQPHAPIFAKWSIWSVRTLNGHYYWNVSEQEIIKQTLPRGNLFNLRASIVNFRKIKNHLFQARSSSISLSGSKPSSCGKISGNHLPWPFFIQMSSVNELKDRFNILTFHKKETFRLEFPLSLRVTLK